MVQHRAQAGRQAGRYGTGWLARRLRTWQHRDIQIRVAWSKEKVWTKKKVYRNNCSS